MPPPQVLECVACPCLAKGVALRRCAVQPICSAVCRAWFTLFVVSAGACSVPTSICPRIDTVQWCYPIAIPFSIGEPPRCATFSKGVVATFFCTPHTPFLRSRNVLTTNSCKGGWRPNSLDLAWAEADDDDNDDDGDEEEGEVEEFDKRRRRRGGGRVGGRGGG